MALAGAAQGFGNSIVEQARAKREEALRAAERQQSRDWATEDRDLGYSERRATEQRGFDRDDASMGRSADALGMVFGDGGASPENVAQITAFYIERGAPPHVAAGLAGNFMQESGPNINTGAVGDNGNSFGAGQWNGPRRRQLTAFAQERGLELTDLDTQLEFSWWEMNNTESSAWEAIMATQTVDEAARVASERYWRPGTPHLDRRQGYARAVFAALSDPDIPASTRELIGRGAGLTGLGADSPVPASGEDGQSVTPEREFRPLPTTVDGQLRRDNRLRYGARGEVPDGFDEGDIDEGLLEAVKMEMERLTNEEGMSVDQARESAMSRLMFNTEETRSARDGLFGTGIGARDAETRNGAFTGFSPFGGSDAPAAPVNQPDPAMPPEPPAPPPRTGLGADPAIDTPISAPTDIASRVVGQLYLSPTGILARWTGEGWEVVQ